MDIVTLTLVLLLAAFSGFAGTLVFTLLRRTGGTRRREPETATAAYLRGGAGTPGPDPEAARFVRRRVLPAPPLDVSSPTFFQGRRVIQATHAPVRPAPAPRTDTSFRPPRSPSATHASSGPCWICWQPECPGTESHASST